LVAGFLGCVILRNAESPLLYFFEFRLPLSPAWTVWRLFTYVLVNPVDFFTPFNIFFFYWFSMGIETHLGRPKLGSLLVLLILVPVIFATFFWWYFGVSMPVSGSFFLSAGMLVAFATLYPNTEAWGWIPFKYMAAACIFCGSLMMLRDWPGLLQLWTSCFVGFIFIRQAKEVEYDDYVSPFTRLKKVFQRKPKFRVVRPAPSPRRPSAADEPPSELDAILDKIAKSGMDSLTPKERAQLQKAREALIRKEQG
jgi:hypothetical protein